MMRLSDVVGALGSPVFLEIGLVLFLLIFLGVLLHTFTLGGERVQYMALLPIATTVAEETEVTEVPKEEARG